MSRNGKEAIETLKNEHVDLTIKDIMMPFASGIEILSAIQSIGKKIPVIILSSMGQEEAVLKSW